MTPAGSHGQLFRPCWGSSAWHGRRQRPFTATRVLQRINWYCLEISSRPQAVENSRQCSIFRTYILLKTVPLTEVKFLLCNCSIQETPHLVSEKLCSYPFVHTIVLFFPSNKIFLHLPLLQYVITGAWKYLIPL